MCENDCDTNNKPTEPSALLNQKELVNTAVWRGREPHTGQLSGVATSFVIAL
jgi:hypothetical protein